MADGFIYSIGGPSGEVHKIDAEGGFGEKIQELFYVPVDEFEATDKSRKALVRMLCRAIIELALRRRHSELVPMV